jgi:O-acetyl-ADP-ribose deacetylase (regulator of RNase III)
MAPRFRYLLGPEDVDRYRWLLQLDSLFQPPSLPRGFDYEAQVDQILDLIWSPRMADVIGIDLESFNRVTQVSVTQQKRELLDVGLTFGPIPSSRAFLEAMDVLLQAENTRHAPAGLRPPAQRALPVRLEAIDGIEVWCGAAAAVRSDLALVVCDLDLSHRRLRVAAEPAIRAHSIAGPRLQTDCGLIRRFFEADFQPGSIALTRGYFAGARYLANAIGPRTDDGIWKQSIQQLRRCYAGLWLLADRVKASRIAVQLIPLGTSLPLQARACEILLEQVSTFHAAHASPPTICVVGHTHAASLALAEILRRQQDGRLRFEGGFLPAGNPEERLSPGTRGVNSTAVFTERATANRSIRSSVAFSTERSSRLR